MKTDPQASVRLPRRTVLAGGALGLTAASLGARPGAYGAPAVRSSQPAGPPVMVGSRNGLPGMTSALPKLLAGADPLDAAIEVVKVVEADPGDQSVGLGGLPNEDGVVQLDAACMHGPTHNSGSVAAIENILHPCEVARLVMERTDHCQIFGQGAYEFARMHGHPHTDLLTEPSRQAWLRWRENLSAKDDYLAPAPADRKQGAIASEKERVAFLERYERTTGTIHCSALSRAGSVGCTTTTSGLAFKIPGRVGDSPILGAGLYCEEGVGSAGATGRGEAAILACGSHTIVELLRAGAHPKDAGLEALRRVTEQARRQSAWQPGLVDADGVPSFGLQFYVLDTKGRYAGVTMKGGNQFAVADEKGGARLEDLEPLH